MIVSLENAPKLWAKMLQLFRESQSEPNRKYLQAHGHPDAVKHHVNVFYWYSQYLPAGAKVLDWGCSYGPDSCMIRWAGGEGIQLHGCDFGLEDEFRPFRQFARADYRQLKQITELPYPNDAFDTVVASGVLEHVAIESDALRELYRVLKPDGLLIISYLPYAGSLGEWLLRKFHKDGGHRRLYGLKETRVLLRKFGFNPIDLRYQTFIPNVVDRKKPSLFKRLIRMVRYPFFRHTVLCCAARKVLMM